MWNTCTRLLWQLWESGSEKIAPTYKILRNWTAELNTAADEDGPAEEEPAESDTAATALSGAEEGPA